MRKNSPDNLSNNVKKTLGDLINNLNRMLNKEKFIANKNILFKTRKYYANQKLCLDRSLNKKVKEIARFLANKVSSFPNKIVFKSY